MADNVIRRFIRIIYDSVSGKKAEAQLAAGLGDAGKKGGANFVRELRAAFDRKMADLKVQLAKGLIDPAQFKAQANLAAKQFNQGIIVGMEQARKAGTLTDAEYLKLGRTLKRTGDEGATAGGKLFSGFTKAAAGIAGFLAANFGIRQFARFLSDSVKAALEAEDSVTRLDSVLRPLGLSYAGVADDVETYLTRLQKTTRFSDEDGREALVNLVAATGDYQLSLRLLDLTAKIAEKRHITMAAAAQTAADASRGLTKGMKDLGISTKDTGDIVAKIDTNLGNLAEEGAKKGSGAIARMNNLWGEFQEKIGAAILGSDNLKHSLGEQGLLGALVKLNEWADKNSKAISGFVNTLVGAGEAVVKFSRFIVTHTPNLYTFGKALDWVRGRKQLFDDVMAGSSTTAPVTPPPPGGGGGIANPEAAARRAAEVEKINTELAIRTIQLEQGLTEAQAREQVRREEIVRGGVRKIVATVEEGWARLAELDAKLALGLGETFTPAVVKATDAVGKLVDRTDALLDRIKKIQEKPPAGPTALRPEELLSQSEKVQAEIAKNAAEHAKAWETPWTHAFDHLKAEAIGQGTLFRDLGEAWAEGGFAGIVKLAAYKVKQNIAQAIEEGAKALGSLFFNPPEAAAHAASAAEHVAAAGAWRLLAGGGGGGSGAAGASSVGGGAAAGVGRSSDLKQPPPEVHVHFKGSSFFLPEVQKQIYASQQEAREKYGQNAKIIVHRDN